MKSQKEINFEPEFEKINYSDRYEKSIRDMNNWLLGISLGIFTILAFKFDSKELFEKESFKFFYITILVFSLFNIGLVGLTKYLIITRELSMNKSYSLMKKHQYFMNLLIEKSKTDDVNEKKYNDLREKFNNSLKSYLSRFNDISRIEKMTVWSIISTSLSVLGITSFIIYSVI